LAAAGVYGVLSYSVQMRRYELGIHLSLGAHTHRVIGMVVKQSMQPVILGVLAGAFVAALSFLVMEKFWLVSFNADIQSVLLTIPVILAIAFMACYLPVRKVVTEDPLKALRAE
jgi:ABC-type antimicrobial peptide transport system permease subunit